MRSTEENNNSTHEVFKVRKESELSHLKRKSETETPRSPSKKPKKEPCVESAASKQHHSPKKRINILPNEEARTKFIYGNYSRYYGYRNPNDLHDLRLDIFQAQKDIFTDKEILDIGCNSGFVTIEIAKTMSIKHITGIDIDKGLVNRTIKFLTKAKKTSSNPKRVGFPFNVSFVHGNYVLRDDVLLEIESPQFDLILCLSVTKWIHLNFGDSSLKQAFRRMYAQLRDGGKLILEAQPWEGYKRRKKLTADIFRTYKSIVFKPEDFTNYMLSDEVGFKSVTLLAVPNHCTEGFRRPIQLFSK